MSNDPKEFLTLTTTSSTAASLTTLGLSLGQYSIAVPPKPPEPQKPSIEIAPDDHPVYSLVGRAASAWAHLEHTLDLIIWDMIGGNTEHIACITAQVIGTTNRYKVIDALIQHKKDERLKKPLEKIRKLKNHTYDPQDDRNRIIHDPWYLYDDKAAQFRAMPPKDP